MMRRFLIIAVFATLSGVSSLAADTFAVAIRPQSDNERAPGLAELVEQGTMDYFFGAGQIVFDLVDDPTDEVFAYHAANTAADGGARYLVIVDLTFTTESERTIRPVRARVTVYDAASQDQLDERTIDASSIEGVGEMTPESIADRLGEKVAQAALAATSGGNQTW